MFVCKEPTNTTNEPKQTTNKRATNERQTNKQTTKEPDAERKKALREELARAGLAAWLSALERKLEQSASGWVTGEDLSVADLATFSRLTSLIEGKYDRASRMTTVSMRHAAASKG